MADIVRVLGVLKEIDTGTVLKYEYGGTVRMVINKATGNITFGAADGTGIGLGLFGEVNINATTGVSEKFYVEHNGLITGYFKMSGGAGTYLQTPSLTTTQRDALTPVAGMVVYNSTTSKLQCYAGGIWNDTF